MDYKVGFRSSFQDFFYKVLSQVLLRDSVLGSLEESRVSALISVLKIKKGVAKARVDKFLVSKVALKSPPESMWSTQTFYCHWNTVENFWSENGERSFCFDSSTRSRAEVVFVSKIFSME